MKEFVDAYVMKREVVEALKRSLAAAQEELDRAEGDLIDNMDANGMKSAKTDLGSFCVTEQIYPALKVEDRDDPVQVQAAWDEVMAFVEPLVFREGQHSTPLSEYLVVPARISLQSMRRREVLEQVFEQVDELGLVIPDVLDLHPRRTIRWTRAR